MANPTETRIRLRPEIEIIRTGPREFTLLDTRDGRHFEIGAEERLLLDLIGRCDSPEEAIERYEARIGSGLAHHQLYGFIEQLSRTGMILGGGGEPVRIEAPSPPVAVARPRPLLNFAFDLLVVLFGWVLHPAWIPVVLLGATLAAFGLVQHWDRLARELDGPMQRYPPLLVLLLSYAQTLLFVNFPRAILTGIACRRFGGYIRSFGPGLYKDTFPTFKCEIGDSMVEMDERGRWTVLGVSPWCQLAIGSAATAAWCLARPGSPASTFLAFLIPPCLLGLVLNANIFYESSAYLMLGYWLDDYRLRDRALDEVGAWLNGRPSPEALTGVERYWLRLYGLACLATRILAEPAFLILVGIWFVRTLDGVGVLFFAALATWSYRGMIGDYLMSYSSVRGLVRWGGAWWVRWPVRLAMLPCFVVLGSCPYAHEIVGECRIVAFEQQGVRARLVDEISEVHVAEGDLVQAGEPIATLVGRVARSDVEAAEAELEGSKAELELLLHGPRKEDIEIASDQVAIRRSQLDVQEKSTTRSEKLFQSGKASPAEVQKAVGDREEARFNLLTAQSELLKLTSGYREESIRSARADVRVLEEKVRHRKELLALTRITAPIAGRVTLPYMEAKKGHQTRPGDLIAIIQDTSKLVVEVAADDAAAVYVKKGMKARIRLHGLYGQATMGRVRWIAPAVAPDGKFANSPIRTDPETYQEQLSNSRFGSASYHLRTVIDLDSPPPGLAPEMTGYSRITVNEDDVLWRAFARPIVRFLRTEVWSWLP